MGKNSFLCIGVDAAKAKYAIAIAGDSRNGEVRYFGQIETTPQTGERFVLKMERKKAATA